MSRRLALVDRRAVDAATAALDALAEALLPRLLSRLAADRQDAEIVDVCAYVPRPRRSVMASCRAGQIAGAVKSGRTWLARKSDVDVWLAHFARPAQSALAVDDLDDVRRALASGSTAARRRAGAA